MGGTSRWVRGYALLAGQRVARAIDPFVSTIRPSFSYGGSYRRGKPDVGDLDIVVILRDGATADQANDAFASVCVGWKLDERGQHYSCGMVPTGVGDDRISVDVWYATRASWGSHLMYVTGSKDYNIGTRYIASKSGLSLSQLGVKRVGGELIPGAGVSERSVCGAIGIYWIPPCQRVSREAAYRSQVVPFTKIVPPPPSGNSSVRGVSAHRGEPGASRPRSPAPPGVTPDRRMS